MASEVRRRGHGYGISVPLTHAHADEGMPPNLRSSNKPIACTRSRFAGQMGPDLRQLRG